MTAVQDNVKYAIVVDNNPGLRNELQASLEDLGIEAQKFSLGKKAYQEINTARNRCDLVVCDMKLDDITAIQFLSALRKNARFNQTHVVITLTKEMLGDLEDAFRLNATGFIIKPFGGDQFRSFLHGFYQQFTDYKCDATAMGRIAEARLFEAQGQLKNALSRYQALNDLGKSGRTAFDIGRMKILLGDSQDGLAMVKEALGRDPMLKDEIGDFLKAHPIAPRGSSSRKSSTEIPDSLFETFGVPFDEINEGFYGIDSAEHAIVASSSFDERTTLRTMLNSVGIDDVTVVAKGSDVLKEISGKRTDFVVCDSQLEDMNFLQLADLLNRSDLAADTNLLAILANDHLDNLEQGFRLGLNGFCPKPYSGDLLRRSLHEMILYQDLTRESGEVADLIQAALAYLRAERIRDSLALIEKALKKKGDDPAACLAMAMILQINGTGAEAVKWYKAASCDARFEPAIERTAATLERTRKSRDPGEVEAPPALTPPHMVEPEQIITDDPSINDPSDESAYRSVTDLSPRRDGSSALDAPSSLEDGSSDDLEALDDFDAMGVASPFSKNQHHLQHHAGDHVDMDDFETTRESDHDDEPARSILDKKSEQHRAELSRQAEEREHLNREQRAKDKQRDGERAKTRLAKFKSRVQDFSLGGQPRSLDMADAGANIAVNESSKGIDPGNTSGLPRGDGEYRISPAKIDSRKSYEVEASAAALKEHPRNYTIESSPKEIAKTREYAIGESARIDRTDGKPYKIESSPNARSIENGLPHLTAEAASKKRNIYADGSPPFLERVEENVADGSVESVDGETSAMPLSEAELDDSIFEVEDLKVKSSDDRQLLDISLKKTSSSTLRPEAKAIPPTASSKRTILSLQIPTTTEKREEVFTMTGSDLDDFQEWEGGQNNKVVHWMEPEVLQAMEYDRPNHILHNEASGAQGGGTRATSQDTKKRRMDRTLGSFTDASISAAVALADQAKLFHSRLLSIQGSDDGEFNIEMRSYAENIGRVFTELVDKGIAIPGGLENDARIIRQTGASHEAETPEGFVDLGRELLRSGAVDHMLWNVTERWQDEEQGRRIQVLENVERQHRAFLGELVDHSQFSKVVSMLGESAAITATEGVIAHDGGKLLLREAVRSSRGFKVIDSVLAEDVGRLFLKDVHVAGGTGAVIQIIQDHPDGFSQLIQLAEGMGIDLLTMDMQDEAAIAVAKELFSGATAADLTLKGIVDTRNGADSILALLSESRQDLSFTQGVGKDLGKELTEICGSLLSQGDESRTAQIVQVAGAQLLEGVFNRGGAIRLLDDIVRAGGGIRILENTIKDGYADGLIREIVDDRSGEDFLRILEGSNGALRIIEDTVREATWASEIGTEIQAAGGVRLIDEVIQKGGATRLLEDIVVGDGGIRLMEQIIADGVGVSLLDLLMKSEGSARILNEAVTGQIVLEEEETTKALTESIIALDEPIKALHEKLWQGKIHFEQQLPLLAKDLNKAQAREAAIKKLLRAAEMDCLTPQALKKVDHALRKAGLQSDADRVLKGHRGRYLKHDAASKAISDYLIDRKLSNKARDFVKDAIKYKRTETFADLKRLAVIAFKSAKYRECRKWCRKMIRRAPDLGEGYNLLGVAYKRVGHLDRAIREYRRGIRKDPECSKLYHNLAIAYAEKGDEKRSKEMYKSANWLERGRKRFRRESTKPAKRTKKPRVA